MDHTPPCHERLREVRRACRLDTPPQGIEAKGLALPRRRHVTSRAAHIGPAGVLHGVLQVGAIKFAIAQQHDLGPGGYQLLDLLDQGDMEVFGKVPLLALAHQPRQRQGSPFIDHMDHQRNAPAPHDTAIDDQHQRLQGQMRQQALRIG